MDWDYARLSKAAKQAGGPEKLIDMLVESGKATGHKEMIPLVFIAALVGALGYAGIQQLIKFFGEKDIPLDEVEAAKEKLVRGIKEYDASHPEESAEDVKESKKEDEDSERTFPGN